MNYPENLKIGDTIGICAPSAGIVKPEKIEKLDLAINSLEEMGYKVLETASVRKDEKGRSASAEIRAKEFMELLLPIEKDSTQIQSKNILRLREDLKRRYYDAPDLQKVGNNAYRFINAVSDFATHAKPLRRTANYNENLFARTIDGNPLIDKAYQLLKTA